MVVRVGQLIVPQGSVQFAPSSNPSTWADDGVPLSDVAGGVQLESLITGNSSRQDNTPIAVSSGKVNIQGKVHSPFSEIFYNRILVEPSEVNLGNLVSSQVKVLKIFNAYFSARTLSTVTLSNGEGIEISGLTLPYTLGALESVELNISVSNIGPANIDATLTLDFVDSVDDLTTKITGARLVGMPFEARSPLTETLAWRTEIMTTINGKEQRVRLRNNPRQSVSVSYPISHEHHNLANNLIYGWQFRRWAIPLWTEIQQLGAISAGETDVTCVTDIYDIRVGGLIILWESVTKNEIIEVATITGSGLTLTAGLTNSYASAKLMPVRLCRNVGGIARDTNGFNSLLRAKFEALDNVRFSESLPDQYNGHDVYYEELLLSGENSRHAVRARVDTVDYKAAVPQFDSPWSSPKITRPYVVIKEGADENWYLKQFLHRRAGRLRPFYLPTFEGDFQLVSTGLLTTALDVLDNSYRQYASDRVHIAIELDDNAWIPAKITGHSDVSSTVFKLAIDTNLNVDASRVKRISFLDLMRLDSDTVSINWIGGGVSKCAINVRQVEA
jgi:hypothetical protein